MRTQLLVGGEGFCASFVVTSIGFGSGGCMSSANMRSKLMMLSEGLITGTLGALHAP
jgi:hypothetical protein